MPLIITIASVLLGAASLSLGAVDFERDVEPIFAEHCAECHGPETQKGKLRLDRLASMLSGGDLGEPVVVPGDPEASFLVRAIEHREPEYEMPPKGDPLTEAQIALIRDWIAAGAKTPARLGPAVVAPELTHWSLQPVKRPAAAGGMDELIRQKLAENGLKPSAEADRRRLIRRLFLVMHGLPPAPERVEAFVNDKRENSWSLLVEEVLASPRYGERWASHWLDLVRFGETTGFETNRERPNAWRFRDWVIQSLNEDKPYDQFVREQIAGDALGVEVGTGFLVAGPNDVVKGQDPQLRLMQRMNELDDMINTTGVAFLGLTTGCARCHNHIFDPISQKDYYSMQAVFAGVEHGDRALPLPEDRKARLAALQNETGVLMARLKPFELPTSRQPVNPKHNIEPLTPAAVKFVRFTIEETSSSQPCIDELEIFAGERNVALASSGTKATSGGDFVHALHKLDHINDGKYGNARSWIAKDSTGWVQLELAEATTIDRIEWARDREGKYADRLAVKYRIEGALEPDKWFPLASSKDRLQAGEASASYEVAGKPEAAAWLARLSAAKQEIESLEKPEMIYAGNFRQPGPTHRLYRGEPDAKREEVGPDAISALVSLGLDHGAPERDRRLALANWVTAEDNPLTARVIANRVWQFQFGTGIVDTPSDFGANGTPPSHPELLDWLAAELVENGWSLKHLHRLILSSQTWRQDSRPDAEAVKVDAASRLLWRFPPRRLEAEAIRDSMLSVSGVLDLTMGGPGFTAFEVNLENVRHYFPKKSYGPADWRRMIYMTKVRQEQDSIFGAFDCPDASQTVPKRSRSTTPLQALNLLNSAFVMQQTGLFAERLRGAGDSAPAWVEQGWLLCFNRPPTADEVADSVNFIQSEGLEQFTRAMLNANEFVFIP